MDNNKKVYGAYVLRFFDDGEAVGIQQCLNIDKDTPPAIRKAITVIAKQINDNFEAFVSTIADKVTKQ